MNVRSSRRVLAAAACIGLLAVPMAAQQASEKVDYDAIYRIKEEGFQRSAVMETMSYLTDVYGPRLTSSPNYKKAAEYAVKKLNEWGLANVTLEPWGPFGPGWSNELTTNELFHQDDDALEIDLTPGTDQAKLLQRRA